MVEALLRRDRLVTIAALVLLCLLAWLYLLSGAGLGMNPLEMTGLALQPAGHGHDGMAMGMGAWTFGTAALYVAMWWVMMIAMMVPAAAPTILLYATVHRSGRATGRPQVGAFVAGYLSIWLVFSIAATLVHYLLERLGAMSAMTMALGSRPPAGGLLIAAGLYQLSPLKQTCLSHCRSPAAFISRHGKPGWSGAVRLGMIHGAFCVGCCWLLMAILFVGGVMNLAWIAALTLLVLAEKLFPAGPWVSRGTGLILIVWGAVTASA